jgi:hypothetical protein
MGEITALVIAWIVIKLHLIWPIIIVVILVGGVVWIFRNADSNRFAEFLLIILIFGVGLILEKCS